MALLPLIMYSEGILKQGIGIELSPMWSEFSNELNKYWNFKSICQDIKDYSYPADIDLVVNTSCEHMSDNWLNAVPKGSAVVLQSTNFEHFEHINRKNPSTTLKNR